MAPPSWTQTVDNIFTSTWSYRKGPAVEQAFMKTPVAFWLREKGRVQSISGYTRIEVPLEYGTNDSLKWIGRGGIVPMTDPELVTMAYEDWKYVAVSISRYGIDDQRNRGKAQLINMVETKLGAAERSIWEEFEAVFFADGTGSDEPNGFQNLIAASPTTGTVHGLNRATYTWWRNQTKTATGAFNLYGIQDMRNLLNTCSKYTRAEINDYMLVTDQTTFEAYEDEGLEMKRLVNQKLFDAGFDTLQFRGRPIMWSPSSPSAKVYFVNTNYLKLVCDEEFFMDMTEWKPIPDQVNDRVAQILCTCNLVTSRPVCHGVLTGITY